MEAPAAADELDWATVPRHLLRMAGGGRTGDGSLVPQGLTHQLSGEITAFKPARCPGPHHAECPWRSLEWGVHSRPMAPPAHAPRLRSDKWVVPVGPTEEELEAERRAEERRQKLIRAAAEAADGTISGNTVATAFVEWRRNAKRQRTYKYGRDRMMDLCASFERGRFRAARILAGGRPTTKRRIGT